MAAGSVLAQGARGYGNQAVITLPPSTWSSGDEKTLMTRDKIRSAAAEGSPSVEPGGRLIERILQQIQLGVEGLGRIRNEILRIGQGTAKEDLEEKDIKPDSGEEDQGNGP